ncbi:MAG: phosphate/phosphite/phosphonate ABC transporter substrate-binding protein, partial [Candidatus Krumholzibacteria bacterium]|nr:phosphate/phosphite/phosphonate ABC transporter substrate-binding protein [Candidatus Krumholzibacteria bacterium]
MKDRIKPIDVSIISTYMGRSLTAVVAVFVIAVAVSALISRRGVERNVIDVCVSDGHEIARSLQVYEPLTILLSRETRRPVILHACVDTWVSGHDVYIMPIDEFFRHGRRLDLEALFEVKHGERDDEAVLIARDSLGMADCADVSPSQVAFSTPDSVNRFWVQMSMLSQRGFKGPNSLSDFRFEGSAFDGTRVVFGVLYGQYRLGACKRSDIGSLM